MKQKQSFRSSRDHDNDILIFKYEKNKMPPQEYLKNINLGL